MLACRMLSWILHRLLALRTWLMVRLGLWRGRWLRGRVTVPAARALHWFGNDTWSYAVYSPAGLRDDQAAPLVVVLHGCRQRALGFAYAAGLTRIADEARVRLLCPEQRRRANLWRCWNWFVAPARRGAGELRVVLAMLDDVGARVRIAPGAVAVVGISAGGALAAALAFHHADRFCAVATVAAPPLLGAGNLQSPLDVMRNGLAIDPALALPTPYRACSPLAILHGDADEVVAYRCAEQLLAQALESWRRAGREPIESESRERNPLAVTDFREGATLCARFVRIHGLGHVWTGGPGGHPYCESGGAALAALCMQFFRDAGLHQPTPAEQPRAG